MWRMLKTKLVTAVLLIVALGKRAPLSHKVLQRQHSSPNDSGLCPPFFSPFATFFLAFGRHPSTVARKKIFEQRH